MHVVSDKEEGRRVVNVNTWEIMASSWVSSFMGWYLGRTFGEVYFPAWLGGLKEYSENC